MEENRLFLIVMWHIAMFLNVDIHFLMHMSLQSLQLIQDTLLLQIRDYRTDWDLEVNEPVAGNYYPVCFSGCANFFFYKQDEMKVLQREMYLKKKNQMFNNLSW